MKQKNLILMVVAVGCGLVAAFLTTQINAKGPRVEQVEVLVAAKDLSVGTQLTKTDFSKLVTKKMVPKDALPPNFVNDENDLIDKRLSTPVQADQIFDPKFLSKGGVIILPEGKDMVSMPIGLSSAAAGFVGPGAHVDVLATLSIKNRLNAFPILVDMQILAVDTKTSYETKGAFQNMSMVSLAVTQEQALLLALAKQRGCHLELLLRNPNKAIDPKYDIKQITKILQDDSPGGINPTEGPQEARGGSRSDYINPESIPPLSAPPVVETKAITVKVLKATGEIAANTEITKDLIAQSFSEKEVPKETADLLQAYGDLTPFLGQVFKMPVAKDQVVLKGMIGPPVSKVAPPEEFVGPKPDAEPKKDPPKPKETQPVAVRKTHDVAFHTANGTEIHRYEEYKPGEWRLQQILTPFDAAKDPNKKPATSGAEATPPTPDTQPPTGTTPKID